jgi:hypothetical protein
MSCLFFFAFFASFSVSFAVQDFGTTGQETKAFSRKGRKENPQSSQRRSALTD